jgi:Rrf2 family protein
MSRLAEAWDEGKTRLSAGEIAESRGLQRPFVAKVLTTLSQAGLVTGSRGPGGGFTLAKEPSKMTLYDVFVLFEREDDSDTCPFGGGTCGVGEECPLHQKLVAVQRSIADILHNTTFEVFREASPRNRNGTAARRRRVKAQRESYRATSGRRRRS